MLETATNYRNFIRLDDGRTLLLRPLQKADRERLVNMFANVSPNDLRYLKDDVTDGELVGSWVDNLDYNRVFPLVSVLDDRIVGEVSLHLHNGPTRHLGTVRIFLSKDFRGQGLGTLMLRELINLGRKAGLQELVAEIVTDQADVIKAFQRLGFKLESQLRDHFMTSDGVTHDVAVLMLPLTTKRDEF